LTRKVVPEKRNVSFFVAGEQTPELVIVNQSLRRKDVASGSAANFASSAARHSKSLALE
jgi:hypothetical protein